MWSLALATVTMVIAALAPMHAITLPSPSCLMGDGVTGLTCPLPTLASANSSGWTLDWSLRNSTACMPELVGSLNNISFVPAPGHHWGMASLDWQVGRGTWLNASNLNASTCEATSIANCRALKASGALTRCSIYHNVELALQWIETSRAVMYDPTKRDWFLQFTDGAGHKNGTIYNQPRAEGDQFFIDYRNADAARYFVEAVVALLVDNDIDATFTDDRDGIPVEHPQLPAVLNLSSTEVAQVQFATQAFGQYLATALAANGKTCWDCLAGLQLGPRPTQGNCAPLMRELCAPAAQGRSMFMGYSGRGAEVGALNESIAAFLISRPPVALFGSRWQDADWSPLFELDVGEPEGLCEESAPGVFSRVWSKGVATLNCTSWTSDLPFDVFRR
jgi:hypothetical protein